MWNLWRSQSKRHAHFQQKPLQVGFSFQATGRESSGLLIHDASSSPFEVHKTDYRITCLHGELDSRTIKLMIGHSRMVTNEIADNQPVLRDEFVVFHNGIIVNADEIWPTIPQEKKSFN